MAILWEDDLAGTPTSGTPNTTDHPWSDFVAGSMAYTASTVNGLRALSAGPTFARMAIPFSGGSIRRLRVIAQWSGTPSTHHYMARVQNAPASGTT